ncbi:unnamed protein product [Pedinophyceae sp. YPF-701]|nr:unnamed protein product [Pedinophyceae sp. YPF-701]
MSDLEDNWELQVDEAVALQAIMAEGSVHVERPDGTAVSVDDLPGGPPVAGLAMILRVNVSAPDGVRIKAVADDDDAGPSDAPTFRGDVATAGLAFSVRYLPPVELTVTFTEGYPGAAMPEACVDAPWLREGGTAALLSGLTGVWEEQGGPGAPVVWAWVTWLEEEALRVACGEGGVLEHPMSGIEYLVRYDQAQRARAFREGMHDCPICMEEKPGTQQYKLPGCDHFLCRACLSDMCATHVREGSLVQLQCPQPDCRRPIAHHVLQDVLPEDLFERWESLTLARCLDAMQDVVYCPRCNAPCIEEGAATPAPPPDSAEAQAPAPSSRGTALPLAQCAECMFAFCTLCMSTYHPGSGCVGVEQRLAELAKRSQAHCANSAAKLEEERRRLQMMEELKSEKMIREKGKQCPTCGIAVWKSEGCNKMACVSCGTTFCWLCGKAIESYSHFNPDLNPQSPCAGNLFDLDEIQRAFNDWEVDQGYVLVGLLEDEHQAHERRRRRARAEGLRAVRAGEGRPCVTCGQPVPRVARNNHMRCANCATAFCFLCGEVLRGKGAGGRHFGPAHKQHGP